MIRSSDCTHIPIEVHLMIFFFFVNVEKMLLKCNQPCYIQVMSEMCFYSSLTASKLFLFKKIYLNYTFTSAAISPTSTVFSSLLLGLSKNTPIQRRRVEGSLGVAMVNSETC